MIDSGVAGAQYEFERLQLNELARLYWQREVDRRVSLDIHRYFQKHPRDFDLNHLQGLS